jgi:hypothetical protein
MKERTHDVVFAVCGVASVAVMLAGVAIGSLGNRQFVTITSSSAQVVKAFATPADTAVWIGAYAEMLSFGLFIAFAVWATAKLGGGLLGQIARAAATGYVTLSIASLCVMDAAAYRSGHGVDLQLAKGLVAINEALFVGTWFLTVFFLAAVGPLAVASGHRLVGWSAVGVGGLTLLLTAVSLDNLGQMANLLWLAWIVGASVALVRGERAAPHGVSVAQHA